MASRKFRPKEKMKAIYSRKLKKRKKDKEGEQKRISAPPLLRAKEICERTEREEPVLQQQKV